LTRPVVVVHGGAGPMKKLGGELERVYRLGLSLAAREGAFVLERGGTSLDAVEAAVRVMEASGDFNAGAGACLDEEGRPTLDAAVMRGEDLAAGGVGASQATVHPVTLARALLDEGRHVLLVGEGADRRARALGLPPLAPPDAGRLRTLARLRAERDREGVDPEERCGTTSGADPAILMQTREDYDGAEPSPNSVAAMNLLRLWQMTDRKDWHDKAEKTFAIFGNRLQEFPQALPQLVAALDFSLSKPKQIIIAGQPDAPCTRALLKLVHQRYIPNKILLLADGGPGQKQLAQWLPFVHSVTQKQGRATAYICENYVCKLPSADPQVVARLLDAKS